MNTEELMIKAVQMGGSDLFIIPGSKIKVKVKGAMVPLGDRIIMPLESKEIIGDIYKLAGRDINKLNSIGDDDFSFSLQGISRFRCNTYKQRSSLSTVIRIVKFGLPDYTELNIPMEVMNLYNTRNGLILVTGSAGSGKTTTQACLIDRINERREGHIITLEDPIEYLHRHKRSLVSQREIGQDTASLQVALRGALRQTPDVILLGEMRDLETMQIALTAAETGQLVISTLHTIGAVKSIDRIIDVFPAHQQNQVRIQLSMVLRAVISQQLLPMIGGGIVPAFEIMLSTPAIRNQIREGKMEQMENNIYAGRNIGMRTMDSDIIRLHRMGVIDKNTALAYAVNKDAMEKRLG